MVLLPAFEIGRFEVTYSEWDACFQAGGCSTRPDSFGNRRGKQPVVGIRSTDIVEYLNWLNRMTNAIETGRLFRLPSEAEWVRAARGSSSEPFGTGNRIDASVANFAASIDGPYNRVGEDRDRPIPVGSLKPTGPWNLHDIHGNVEELVASCQDASEGIWPQKKCSEFVMKGGAWTDAAYGLRVSDRIGLPSGSWGDLVGFRVLRKVPSRFESEADRNSTTENGIFDDVSCSLDSRHETIMALAARGDPVAAFCMANRLAEGRGISANDAEAVRWYRRSAVRGFGPAVSALAYMHEHTRVAVESAVLREYWKCRAAGRHCLNEAGFCGRQDTSGVRSPAGNWKSDHGDLLLCAKQGADRNFAILQGTGSPGSGQGLVFQEPRFSWKADTARDNQFSSGLIDVEWIDDDGRIFDYEGQLVMEDGRKLELILTRPPSFAEHGGPIMFEFEFQRSE